ncbi:hypothetical protein PR003_g3062 [Phytophthora rubi]|uniref:Peptidase A2 domain-containing protein n=1 Tax=Phytophthora rubi TaxID=129364 RepID=A0A6A4G4U6_9STRA|nr:hypothetical protein PR003_g3062 [Phytophthora rubi]
MNGSKRKDDKELYLTYSIVVRHADKEMGIEEEIVTKKMPKFIDGGPKDFLDDEEYMFVGVRAQSHLSPLPMRIMIKLEHIKEQYHALLDSGCSRSIICSDFMQELQSKGSTLPTARVSFTLAEGNTSNKGNMIVRFSIPQFKRDSVIVHAFEDLPNLKDEMVIGRDIMTALGLVVDFGAGRIQ